MGEDGTLRVVELITIQEAADELGIHVKSVFRMLTQGRLKRYQRGLGRRTFVDRAEIQDLLAVKPKPAAGGRQARRRAPRAK